MSETHWKKLTNPNYLGEWDFATGEERVLTIKSVSVEEVIDMESNGTKKKPCTVAHFVEPCKPMILNKTNCKTITMLYDTPFIERWAGRRIMVHVEKVKAFGKLTPALRVMNKAPVSPTCSRCKKIVVAIDGYTSEQIVAMNVKRYGEPLCAECSKKEKAGGTNNVNQ